MSLEIQDLADLLRILTLIELRGKTISKDKLKHKIERVCKKRLCIEEKDINEALKSMVDEGLIVDLGKDIKLTSKGARISSLWRSFLLKVEPVLEIIVGVADGSITSLIIIISYFIAELTVKVALITFILSLTIVALTNFSSFLLGGLTEDLADLETLQNLIVYSLSDIFDMKERRKALLLAKEILNLLRSRRSRIGVLSALACSAATFVSGIVPLTIFLFTPQPFNIIFSLCVIGAMIGFFLIYYRSQKTKMPWKVIFIQTIIIVTATVFASLLLGANI